MSRHDYEVSKVISQECAPFYSLIMAAMRQADTENLMRLRQVFPDTYAELDARYNAPGGVTSTDEDYEEYTRWRAGVMAG
jgi:hypothetical protein